MFSRFVYTRTFTPVSACKITGQWESTLIDFRLMSLVKEILLQKKLEITPKVSSLVHVILNSILLIQTIDSLRTQVK